jgi:tetratricopeptide (TPR) repeat protein
MTMNMILKEWLALAPPPRPLENGDKWNVFLSYRSINRSWVLNLYDVLKQAGHHVFLDQYELAPGDALISKLEEGLSKSQAGILIWSTGTSDSDWVRREYEVLERQATEKNNFYFLPIKLDKAKLPLFASGRTFIDFASYPDGPNGGELLRLLHAVVGRPLSDKAVHFANDLDEASMVAGIRIEAALKNGLAPRIIALVKAGGLPWEVSSALGCKAAEALTRLNANEDAIAVLRNVMAQFPRAIRPKQLYALALARKAADGDLDEAQEVLAELYVRGERDPETLGIYGRTWMDRYHLSGDKADLKKSRDLYAEAFAKAPDDYYTGVNAAAKSVLLGSAEDMQKAVNYASQVQEVVSVTPWPDDYWKTATVAEVLLIRKQYEQAAAIYQAAIDMAPKEKGSHQSTRKQAYLLMERLTPAEEDRNRIVQVFDANAVI